jgi:hypothetical protein
MKDFILKTIYISLPILIFGLFLEISLRNLPNDFKIKKNYLDTNAPHIETLILGSSHSFYGLNPDYFSSKTFNASNISQSLNYDFKILQKYQDKLQSLKTIVLPISYFTLFSKLEAGSESWRIKNYVLYFKLNSNVLTHHSEVLTNKLKVNTDRLISSYFTEHSNITCTTLGWGTKYNWKNARDLDITGEIASKRHTLQNIYSDKNQQIFNENISVLNSIIKWADNNNIKIVFITPPAYETYRKHLNIEQLNTTIKTTIEICNKYKNCFYENLLEDDRFIAKDFYDADHLSNIGAEKLSKFINNKIIALE